MAWDLLHNRELNILELTFKGAVNKGELLEVTKKVIECQKDLGQLCILVDAVDADINVPLVDLFDLPDRYYQEYGANVKNKLALLPPQSPKGRKDAEFFVHACENRGRIVKLFCSQEKALHWLLSSHEC